MREDKGDSILVIHHPDDPPPSLAAFPWLPEDTEVRADRYCPKGQAFVLNLSHLNRPFGMEQNASPEGVQ